MSCRPRGCKESDVTGLPNNNGNQHPGKTSGLNIPETQQLQQTGWLRAFLLADPGEAAWGAMGPQKPVLIGDPPLSSEQVARRQELPSHPASVPG